jgi:hypothetical protein
MLSTDTQGPTMKREQKLNILMNKKNIKNYAFFHWPEISNFDVHWNEYRSGNRILSIQVEWN